MRFISAVLILFFPVFTNAQLIKLPPGCGDCLHAINIGTDTVYGPVTAPRGGGKIKEVSNGDDQNLYFFYTEHNTVWYHFIVPYNALLNLELIPVHAADDVDFLLFREEGENFCDKLAQNAVLPLRTNISRVDSLHDGITGLRMSATQKFVHGGPGDVFSSSIQVLKGENYYLVVDHFRKHKTGHTLKLHYTRKEAARNSVLEGQKKLEEMLSAKAGELSIYITDAKTDNPINANLEIFGTGKQALKISDTSTFLLEMKKYRSYIINCNKKGYMYYSKRIVTGSKSENIRIDISLEPIAEGQKITLNDIYFKGDKAEILPTSESALKTLLDFLMQNPDVNIEIQGHVNAKRNNKKARQLSKDRAAAVYYYLVLKDVPKSRMTFKGYGNTRMIYPHPDNAQQSAANRRVEIRIMSRD